MKCLVQGQPRIGRRNTAESINAAIIATVQHHRPTATDIHIDSQVRNNIANGRLYSIDYTVDGIDVTGYVLRRSDEYIFFYDAREVLGEVEKHPPVKGITLTPEIFAAAILTLTVIASVIMATIKVEIPQTITAIASAAAGFLFGRRGNR
jgi:hypothetical protein